MAFERSLGFRSILVVVIQPQHMPPGRAHAPAVPVQVAQSRAEDVELGTRLAATLKPDIWVMGAAA